MDFLRLVFWSNAIHPEGPIDDVEASVSMVIQHGNLAKADVKRLLHWYEIYGKKRNTKRERWKQLIIKQLKKDLPMGIPATLRPYIWMVITDADIVQRDEATLITYHVSSFTGFLKL
jgi:hypothetical protein